MNKKMKLSIIIPVYNVELYVEKCLRSCAEQDLSPQDYEIIVINDGTKDNSLEIAERVAKDYSNIIIHSQDNQGLSAARNKGLSLAKGEYVWFIDSDDWIEQNCLNDILDKVKGSDVLAMGYILAYDDKELNQPVNYSCIDIKTGKDLLLKGFFTMAQMYVYKRSFLLGNKLLFYLGIYHEDSEFTPRMLYAANSISILDNPIYYFYKRPNSITTTPNPKRAFDCIIVAHSLSDFSKHVDKDVLSRFDYLISMNINNSLANTYEMTTKNKKELNEYIFKHKSLFKHLNRSKVIKYKLEGILFYLFPKKTVEVYQLIQKFNI